MKPRILVIDDDDLIRSLVQHILSYAEYEVLLASHGAAGIDLFEEHRPALVILDIAMPEMSGIEVAGRLRAIEQREQRPRTPIILLTAYARSFFVSASGQANVDSYLTKPITPEKLLVHVDRFLQGSDQDNSSE